MIGRRLVLGITVVVVSVVADFGQSLGSAGSGRDGCNAPVLALAAPDRLPAGERATVVVTSPSATGTLPVVVRAGTMTYRFTVEVVDGSARLELGRPLTEQAGSIEVRAGSLAATIEVAPGSAIGEFPVLAGPHTVVADGADRAVAVAIPRDRWGNPVADGTEVRFFWKQPGPHASSGSASVDRLLAWDDISSGTEAGRVRITAAAGSATGPEALIAEVPGPAARVEMEPIVLDGTEFGDAIVLQSGPIADRFANMLPDGVEGRFRVETAGGVHIVPGVVQAGRLRAWWIPERGPVTITAAVNGVVSPPLTMVLFEDVSR